MEDFEAYISRHLAENFSVDGYIQFLEGYYDDDFDCGRYLVKFPEKDIAKEKPSDVTITNLRFIGGNSTNLTLGEKSSVLKMNSYGVVFDIMTPIASSRKIASAIEVELDRIFLNQSFAEPDFQIMPDWSNPKRTLKTPASNSDIYNVKTLTYRFNLMYI